MQLLTRALLTVTVIVLAYFLYKGINDPVQFEKRKLVKYEAVKERLRDILVAEEAFKQVKGEYASSFDELEKSLLNDSIIFVRSIGIESDTVEILNKQGAIELWGLSSELPDSILFPQIVEIIDDINEQVRAGIGGKVYIVKDSSFIPVMESISMVNPVDSLRYIPYSGGEKFEISASVQIVGPGRIPVPVFEVIAYNKSILKGESSKYYFLGDGIRLGSISEPRTDIVEFRAIDE